jgi:hypothetical protein
VASASIAIANNHQSQHLTEAMRLLWKPNGLDLAQSAFKIIKRFCLQSKPINAYTKNLRELRQMRLQ